MKHKHILIDNKVEIVEDRDDAVWAMNVDYKLTAFNASFGDRLSKAGWGKPERGMDLRPVYQSAYFFNPSSKGCAQALDRYPTTSKHTFEKNGELTVHEFSFQPFMDNSGEVIGCCIWQKDISQAVKNIHKLQESERRYREAQEITVFGHWNWDIREDKISWSNQLFRIFEQEPGKFEATFDALMKIIHPEDRDGFVEDVQDSIKKNRMHDVDRKSVV